MELIPSEHRLRWLLASIARLHEAGAEPVAGLVLPTAQFFPDAFDASPRAVDKLLRRVLKHGGLSDVDTELALHGDEGNCSTGACSTPATAPMRRIERTGEGYRVAVHAAETRHATVLTTALARAAAFVWLSEAEHAVPPGELEDTVDLAGVLLGFGVLLCNGAYIYQKGCGGVRVSRATRLSIDELSVALAIFCKLHRENPRSAARELDASAKDFFSEACRWATSNERAIALVAADLTAIEAGSYSLNPSRGWLSRLVGLGRARTVSAPDDAELDALAAELTAARDEQPPDAERARRLAELRELVDDALPAGDRAGDRGDRA